MKKINLTILFAIFLFLNVFSQDKIYKKNGNIIEVSVVEIGESEIKYKLFNDINGPTYVVDKDRLRKTIYKNGREEIYTTALKDTSLYLDHAKSAIKINFLAPLFGYTQINYERSIKPGRSYEISLGIIGLGKKQELFRNYYINDVNQKQYRGGAGAFVGAGYKFLTLPNFIRNGDKYSHVLQGWYAKPEVILALYTQNDFDTQTQIKKTEKETLALGAFILNVGKQWVLGNAFLIDIYGGLGYAAINKTYDSSRSSYDDYMGNHFVLNAPEGSGIGFSGGFKIGLLLNKKK